MTLPARAAVAAIAFGFLALHLPYLPASLEDLDSINFALGLRHYDVAQHQPHPPGYPVFIALGRAAHRAIPSEAHALSAVGIIAGALGVLALFAFYRAIGVRATGRTDASPPAVGPTEAWLAAAAALVAATSPLYWFTAARPLSDTTGLAAAVAVQAWTLLATTPASFAAAAFAAGLAAGVRSQVLWLTIPLLVWAAVRRTGHAPGTSAGRARDFVCWPAAAFVAGALVWAIPLLVVTGGPAAYWRAIFSQGAEDLTGIQMLWTHPTPRVLVSALYYAFVAPWALWSVATVVLVFAAVGALLMSRYWRAPLLTLVVAYVPYFVFDLLFQETFTTRYALPLVVPVAYLTVRGAAAFGRRPGLVVALALGIYDAHVGGTSIAAYAREKAPAFRMLDDMARAASPQPPVLGMDRREQLDLRRPIAWERDHLPQFAARLPSPPQHEWLELVNYWNGGGGSPIWFVADPLRTDVDLVQHGEPARYRWSVPYPVLLGGVRPNEMDWHRLERPDWYVGEGWALTPEAAGVSQVSGRGLANGPIDGWVSRSALTGGSVFVIGGRNFDPTLRPRLAVTVGDRTLADFAVTPGAFVHMERLPFVSDDGLGSRFQRVTVSTTPPAAVGVEQFDVAPPGRVAFAFGNGWNEQEFNPANGRRWRWLSERGELLVMGNQPIDRVQAVRLHLEGESPKKYFSKASHLVVRVGGQVAFDDEIADDFSIDVTVPGRLVNDFTRPTVVVLETDQVYVPAERSSRSPDRRHLGLRVFKCELRAGS